MRLDYLKDHKESKTLYTIDNTSTNSEVLSLFKWLHLDVLNWNLQRLR